MNWDAIGAVGELIGAAAVVISVGYLALQVRQNTKSQKMNAEIAMSHEFADWATTAIDNPRIGEIWDLAATDPDSLSDEDARLYIWYIAKIFLLYEGQFNLFSDGHISEAAWNTKMTFLVGTLGNPLIEKWWSAKVAPFSPEYFEYVDSRRGAPEYQWEIRNVLETSRSSA